MREYIEVNSTSDIVDAVWAHANAEHKTLKHAAPAFQECRSQRCHEHARLIDFLHLLRERRGI